MNINELKQEDIDIRHKRICEDGTIEGIIYVKGMCTTLTVRSKKENHNLQLLGYQMILKNGLAGIEVDPETEELVGEAEAMKYQEFLKVNTKRFVTGAVIRICAPSNIDDVIDGHPLEGYGVVDCLEANNYQVRLIDGRTLPVEHCEIIDDVNREVFLAIKDSERMLENRVATVREATTAFLNKVIFGNYDE